MSQLHNFDWRKNASAAAQQSSGSDPSQTSDNDVEKAFMETAYTAVANKAGQLMEPANRLGFEIVSKNDTNTRLLGVFAFRVANEMLYAPVFFLNGDIKGTDLLYRHRVKRFLPMSEKIIRRLVSLNKSSPGYGVDRSFARKQPQALHLERVAFPPPTYKSASLSSQQIDLKALEQDLLEVRHLPTGVLADFMQNQGGQHALQKLASLIENVPSFGKACDELLTRESIGLTDSPYPIDVAVEQIIAGTAKRASAAEISQLRTLAYEAAVNSDNSNVKMASAFFGTEQVILRRAEAVLFDKSASADARDKASKNGYDLLDTRQDLKPAIVDGSEKLCTLTRPGRHTVLNENGDKIEARVFRRSGGDIEAFLTSPGENYPYPCSLSEYSRETEDYCCVTTEAKARKSQMLSGPETLVAECDSDADLYDGLVAPEDVKTGTVYQICNKSTGELYQSAFLVESKSTDEQGLIALTVRMRWDGPSEGRLMRINPDTSRNSDRVLGNCTLFIPMATESVDDKGTTCCPPSGTRPFGDVKTFFVVSRKDLTSEMRKSAYQEAKLHCDSGFYSLTLGGQRQHEEVRRVKAACALVSRLELPAASAEQLLDLAASNGSVNFWFSTEGKQAGAIQLENEPAFHEDVDNDFGVTNIPDQGFALRTTQLRNYVPNDRIGDHANLQPEGVRNEEQHDYLPEEVLLNSKPEDLAAIAGQLNVPKLFEVGVVGSLASAYHSATLIAQSLPKIEEAIDALGRALFLFYWKPEDFKKAYGEDDLPGLEMELTSQFKSLGDIWLKLSQASPDKDPLAAPLPL
jgi:hypothetical protein